jgi:NAD(P)-dependent dehydrogenase (short-subunit alcohol dehydrogenase family)
MPDKRTVLVTGGAGFIGANFVLDWLSLGRGTVVNLDKLTYAGNRDNLANVAAAGLSSQGAFGAQRLKKGSNRAKAARPATSVIQNSNPGNATHADCCATVICESALAKRPGDLFAQWFDSLNQVEVVRECGRRVLNRCNQMAITTH